jgi:hypothetical protein
MTRIDRQRNVGVWAGVMNTMEDTLPHREVDRIHRNVYLLLQSPVQLSVVNPNREMIFAVNPNREVSGSETQEEEHVTLKRFLNTVQGGNVTAHAIFSREFLNPLYDDMRARGRGLVNNQANLAVRSATDDATFSAVRHAQYLDEVHPALDKFVDGVDVG